MTDLVADASFYLCFLDDINEPETLLTIIKPYTAHTSPTIHAEISKSKNFGRIKESINPFQESELDLGKIIRPFFSKAETAKGEHELIVVAYVLFCAKHEIVLIIDDDAPRKFVHARLPLLIPKLTGTVGFVGDCCCIHKTANKPETLRILSRIKASKFRIAPKIIDGVIDKVTKA